MALTESKERNTRPSETDRDRPSRASQPPHHVAPKAFGWNVVAATLLAAILRCFRLGEQSLWIDEVFTWYNAAIGQPLGALELFSNIHGPLHALILHGWGSVAGDSEWALRLPSAVFGTAMVPAMAWLARRWLGSDTAVAAAWLTAASPFLVWYGQEARNYSLLMLCAVVSATSLLGLRERVTPGRTFAYLGAAAAGVLSNLSFVFLAPLHLRWWLAGSAPTRARLGVLVVVALGLVLIAAPWLRQSTDIWDWERLDPTREAPAEESPLRGLTTFHSAALPYAAHTFSVGYTLGPSPRELRGDASAGVLKRHLPIVGLSVLVFGALAVLGLVEMRRRRRLLEALIWLVVPALLVSYVAIQNFKVFHPRYVAVAMPALLLVFAAGFASLRPRARMAFAAVVAVLWGASLWNHYFVPSYGKEDFRSAAALIASEGTEGEKVVAVNSVDMLDYYYRGPMPVESFWLGFARDPAKLRSRFTAAVGADSVTGRWIVMSRPEDLDPHGAFVRLMTSEYPAATRHTYEGVTVWHLDGRSGNE